MKKQTRAQQLRAIRWQIALFDAYLAGWRSRPTGHDDMQRIEYLQRMVDELFKVLK